MRNETSDATLGFSFVAAVLTGWAIALVLRGELGQRDIPLEVVATAVLTQLVSLPLHLVYLAMQVVEWRLS
jgi:hypothetical protein